MNREVPATYALVTPTRDELVNLQRLARCLEEQTVQPQTWIIVDNGSADGTLGFAHELEERVPWVTALSASGTRAAEPGAPIVRAFHHGLGALTGDPDVVVKLDADVSVEPDYFERLLCAFANDPSLGITSGVCLEQREGSWTPTYVTRSHVRGATRAYRWQCLQDVLPLEERVGWDGIDELKANVHGWRTEIVRDLAFYHHRALGSRDGARSARWVRQGNAAHYMGYRFVYLVLRTLHHARRDPAALAMLYGYLGAWLRRAPQHQDDRVRRQLRDRQSLRNLRARRREALGRQSH
jgi:glycosyltransferase involved in cell wall biosynthesis